MDDNIPTLWISEEEAKTGIPLDELFVRAGLCKSKSEFRRLVKQGGAYINNKKIIYVGDLK